MIPARRRHCVARAGCVGVAVAYVPAPRGTVGRISACADCYQRETGRPWDGPVPAVVPPPRARQAPALRLVEEPARPAGRPRALSADALLSPTTRAVIWVAEHAGRPVDREAMRQAVGMTPTAASEVVRYMRSHEWLSRRDTVTAAGLAEAKYRREALAKLPPEVVAKGRHKRASRRDPSLPRFPSGRGRAPSDQRAAEAARWRAEEALLGQVRTRLLWWLMQPRAPGWMGQAAADLGLSLEQIKHANKAIVAAGWADHGRLTAAGKVEAQRRMDIKQRHDSERPAVQGWAAVGGAP